MFPEIGQHTADRLPPTGKSAPIRYSAYGFTGEHDIPFDIEKYSKFKFGCKDSAREFGTELAKKFIAGHLFRTLCLTANLWDKRIVVLSSPYVHIPTATFALKDYFIRGINAALHQRDMQPVQECKIYRRSSYKEEYGDMNKEQRYAVMANDNFYVDACFLEGKICIFLDDIRITGGHEHRIQKMLAASGLSTAINYFVYFAELTNKNCNPTIENYLNYAYIKDLRCLDKIIKNEPFIMNTRVVKYILDSEHEQCKHFLEYQKPVFLDTLYHNAIGNSYHLIPDYSANLNYLKTLL